MSNNQKFKFLMHAEDGSFPYLTEYLLRKYFNPDDEIVKDHLILGIAIKDTCVQPVYTEKENTKLKRKRSDGDSDAKDSGTKTSSTSNGKNTIKPTGYTYSTKSLEDQTRLLPGYRTLAVPSFDLVDDAKIAMEKETVNRAKNAQMSKNGPKAASSTVPSVTSTRDKLSLISPNGLQQITPVMYAEVSNKLQCDSVLALYDQAHQDEGKKRKAAAGERSKVWLEKFIGALEPSETKSTLWAALSCYDSKWSFADSINYLSEHQQSCEGIAIIGWHHIQSRDERVDLLRKLGNALPSKSNLAILAASNLSQILDAARNGVTTIGSSLPVTWARSYKALNLSLSSPTGSQEGQNMDSDGCIDLSNEMYCCDASPILPGCQCLSCTDNRYTKAYVHHLIKANEMLAQILLFGHNLHQKLFLFREMSRASSPNKVEQLCSMIESQICGKYTDTVNPR